MIKVMPVKAKKSTKAVVTPEPEPTPVVVAKKKGLKRWIFFIGIGGVMLSLVGTSGYFFMKYQSAQTQVQGTADTKEADDTIKKVGELVLLPEGEQATLATVTDITKLAGQTFFARAKNGDKVLIYEQSKKAILYRPSSNMIIDIGPVGSTGASTGTQTATPSATETISKPVRVAIYNGTTTSGLTRKAEPELVALSSLQVAVVAKENASSSAYTESVVIDLTGQNQAAASQLATYAKGQVGTLPAGEAKPEADILIILGDSYTQ
jgi:hypothetical protein